MASSRSLLPVFAALFGLGVSLMWSPTASATPRHIQNTATLDFTRSGEVQSVQSNTTSLDFDAGQSPTTLTIYDVPAGFNYGTWSCQAGPPQMIVGATMDAATFAQLKPSGNRIHPRFAAVLWDATANLDPNVRDTEKVQAQLSSTDTAWLILTETGPDTGIFAGAFITEATPSSPDDCVLTAPTGSTITVSFPGDGDSLPSQDAGLIDPFGHVFDSVTGEPVNNATITLIDDSTGQPARVVSDDGHTVYPSTVLSGQPVADAGGASYVYAVGDYRFPMIAAGHYHLQITAPAGYLAPSLVAPADLPEGPNGPYPITTASYGDVFTLATPDPLEVDIPLDPLPHGTLQLDKTTSVHDASPGDLIPYHLHVTNPESLTMRGAVITDTLPAGLRYKPGMTHGVAEPTLSSDGRTLTFSLPDMAASQALDISYVAEVAPGAPTGDAVNRAVVQIWGSAPSPVAAASVRIHALLFADALTLIGRVSDNCDPQAGKGVAGVRILMEDGSYAVTDRDGLYHFEGVKTGRHVVQIDTNSTAGYEVVACHDDTRSAGNALSRFVEGEGGTLQRVDFVLKSTGKPMVVAQALPITVTDADIAAGGHTDWLKGQTPGIAWLFPGDNHNPRAPALRVVIKHAPGQRIALTVNGQLPDPLAFDGVDQTGKNPESDVAISTWTGLPLKDGDNVVVAKVLAADGSVVTTLTRTVHYANTPYTATFVPELSRLVADGKSQALIAVRLTDRDGRPVRDGTIAAYRLDPPYVAAQDAQLMQQRQLEGMDGADTTVRVTGDDGMAFIALQPTTQAGQAHVTFNLTADKATKKSEMRPWLVAGDQDWVVVGFAAGTLGFDTLSKNLKHYWLPKDRNLHSDGEVSFYAKGKIKGSWLMTLAYDSDRTYDPDTGLLSDIDPDRYYTVYGDGTAEGHDAATSRKLYLRLERKDAYLMAGDFTTGMNDTQLARFSRTLNGVRAGYHGDKVTATAFAARSDQRYARDEIQGNGLSGPYRLSAGGLIANSDQVTIETRDRFRSEKIIDSKPLTRHIDYDIDPDAGTITFREPVLSRDADLNPIFIVVDYEIAGSGDKRLVAGARVTAKVSDKLELGASALRDDTANKAEVIAADAKFKLNDTTDVRAEAANGGEKGGDKQNAYLMEVEHHGKTVDVLAYVRHQDADFGVGQQNFGEAGTHKIGVDIAARLSDKATLTASAWRQNVLGGPEVRTAFDTRLDFRRKSGTWFVAATGATDENVLTSPGSDNQQVSRLVTLGGTQDLMDGKLQLTGQVQAALGGAKDNAQFPVRDTLSLAYKINDSVRLLASHEIADGSGYRARTTRFGFDFTPWHGAKLAATLNQLALGENGARSYAEFGLNQSVPVGDHWTLDATLDSSHTLKGHIAADAINPFQPLGTGGATSDDVTNGNYVSATFGATYRAKLWTWDGRVEARRTDLSRRYGLSSNLIRSLGEGKTVASSLRYYSLTDIEGRKAVLASADVDMAWRPLGSRWSVMERLQYIHNRADAGVTGGEVLGIPVAEAGNQVSTRLINNVSLNYTGDRGQLPGVEATVYYGAKLVRGKLSGDAYDGFIDVLGLDIRKNLGKRFDIAFALSQQTAHDSGVKQMSYGPSLGFSPKKDVWISAGYNISGYHDPNAYDRYTQQGVYVTVRVKFDQTGFRNLF